MELHVLADAKTLYQSIVDFLALYEIFVEFEQVHLGGEKHIIARKISNKHINGFRNFSRHIQKSIKNIILRSG